jgi:choline dehydrogenase-like flavoprotein
LSLKNTTRLPKLMSGAAQMAYSLKVKGRRLVSPEANISMNIETEQRPRADSRILISGKLNAVGIPETIVDWKISDSDGAAIRAYAPYIAKFLNGLGMTEFEWCLKPDDDVKTWTEAGADILHPMGGARMGTSPETSVVDPDLRVHGVANLYVASCATYPTGGSSNPTFSLMALSLRLADLLRRQRGE